MTKLLLKKSSVVGKIPLTTDLDYGELALNFADGKLYYKSSTNTIEHFGNSDVVINLIDSDYVQARQDYDYNSLTNKPNVLDSGDVISIIDSDHVQARQDYDYGSLENTPNVLDSSDVEFIIDSDYIQQRQLLVDSASVIALIDSAHVQARQDYDYNSLINTPNVLDSSDVEFIIDSDYINARATDNLDSAEVISLVDSAYVQSRQDYAYTSLTGAPTNVSHFTNDAGYTTYDSSNTTGMLVGYALETYVDNAIDDLINGAPGTLDTLNEIAAALNDDDSAYATLVGLIGEKVDSADVVSIVDSAYVQDRQDYAYSSLTGAPNVLDSSDVQFIIDSDYIQARQNLVDSASIINLVDSSYVQARQSNYSAERIESPTDSDVFITNNNTNFGEKFHFVTNYDSQYAMTTILEQFKILGQGRVFTNRWKTGENNTVWEVSRFQDSDLDDGTGRIETRFYGDEVLYYALQEPGSDAGAPFSINGSDIRLEATDTITFYNENADERYTFPKQGNSGQFLVLANDPENLEWNDIDDLVDSAYIKFRMEKDSATLGNVNITDQLTVEGDEDGQQVLFGNWNPADISVYKAFGLQIDARDHAWAAIELREYVGDDSSTKPIPGIVPNFTNPGLASSVIGGTPDNPEPVPNGKRLFSVTASAAATDGILPSNSNGRLLFTTTEDQTDSTRGVDLQIQTIANGNNAPANSLVVQGNQIDLGNDQHSDDVNLVGQTSEFNISSIGLLKLNPDGDIQIETNGGLRSTIDSQEYRIITPNFRISAQTGNESYNALEADAERVNVQVPLNLVNLSSGDSTGEGTPGNGTFFFRSDTEQLRVYNNSWQDATTTDGMMVYDEAGFIRLRANGNWVKLLDSAGFDDEFNNRNAADLYYDPSGATYIDSSKTNVQDAINWLDANKVEKSDLSTTLVLFSTDVAWSEDSNYFLAVTSIDDSNYPSTAVDISTGAFDADNTLVGQVVSEAGVFDGNPGYINIHQVGNIKKVSGNSSAFYFTVLHRDSAGTETLMGTSSNTTVIDNTDYEEFFADALLTNPQTFGDNDRVVIKYYSTNVQGNATFNFQFGGSAPVRANFPVAAEIVVSEQDASQVLTSTTNFTQNLSSSDTTVQAALETLDQLVAGVDSATITSIVDSDYVLQRALIATDDQIVVDEFTGDSSTAAFTLSTSPRSDQHAVITINGVLQPIEVYSLSNSTLTFNEAPALDDDIEVRTFNFNSRTVEVRDYAQYVYQPSSPTTVFSGSDIDGDILTYDDGKVQVFLNGSQLVDGLDYTAGNGTSITLLGSPADSGDTLSISSLAKASFADPEIKSREEALSTDDSDQVVDTFNANTYRTAKYLVQMRQNQRYHSQEVLLVHDGTTAYITTYADIYTESDLGEVSADISGGNVRLLVTPNYTNTNVRTKRIDLGV